MPVVTSIANAIGMITTRARAIRTRQNAKPRKTKTAGANKRNAIGPNSSRHSTMAATGSATTTAATMMRRKTLVSNRTIYEPFLLRT